ncbi:hypothetical protein NMY22_g18849 [Coprinellus aureogranulatus]|nr:hypothetical protein NMY22_g18849 [Coprinellus aureogranulatus]
MRRDDLGLLKEGQIYFKSSQPLKDENEMAYHVITGEVVIGRYPMRLPSDLQKVEAIDIPEYALYTDVVIVPVNGTSSLPSLLSGGDMDGDIVNIFRDPELVRHFVNKPLTEEPAGLKEATFEQNIVSVQSFCSKAKDMAGAKAQEWYLEFILKDLITPQKGMYSMFHDNSVSRFGYDHPDTIRLAYVFNHLLDASKSGLRLQAGLFEKDKKLYGVKPQPFGILAELQGEGVKILEEFMRLFEHKALEATGGKDVSFFKDKDLAKPYEDAMASAHFMQEDRVRPGEDAQVRERRIAVGRFMHDELRAIRRHVEAAKDEFMIRFGKRMQQESQLGTPFSPTSSKPKPTKSYGKAKSDQADEMYKAAKMFGEPIPGITIYQSNIEEMKASCAVYSQSPQSAFPWSVGFRGLCTIKAKARGIAPAIREIDECKGMSSSVAKVLSKTAGAVVF